MIKTSTISARIDPELKNKAERVFKELGLSSSQAITLFYKQVELQQGLPFIVKIPNKLTAVALEDARLRSNLESFNTPEDLFDDLGI
ncbi:MAG: type II toxin-antitoxin system RelB/DinJ family antitoxin [Anaerolineae bacterium]|uniref:Type II toxin-antitoxin system RelB/DinJ family antitoxin n=1 Tax=Candidatus Desulfolinea nitratireducens TaxID=2841698 RepID=A0A8J6TGU3_9CHLR|nr:type II toxin-antitoxin system RelB/DinJ family antitoxin [Candidatus Desulfolinea nitratireducens]MBL6961800.1 type II toxin-antitoxin system RelB/DinJ family antitoxin [Anaerolineales bacterium]NQU30523.1 type II toxin-antitoxin system RelB/DinJ family antitoxin [Anaerolineae bacterium]